MKKFRNLMLVIVALLVSYVLGTAYFIPRFQPSGPDREIRLASSRYLSPGQKDPYYSTVILMTWEPLVAISNTGNLMPKLAERWESNADKTVWTFTLKKGVRFHDGVPFNAKAVLANFQRYRNMGYRPSTFYGFAIERVYPGLRKTEVLDDYTVRLHFRSPVPMLIYRMAGWGSAIFSPQCFDARTGLFTKLASGTGPFKLAECKTNQYTVLERNEDYYGEKAKAKRIRILVIPSPEARYSALKSGEIQGVIDLGGLTPILTEELLKDSRFACHAQQSTISHYLSLNGNKFPFNDERMRKAVNLAVDREAVVRHYFRNYATPTRSLLNSTNPFTKVYPPRHDTEKAIQLAQQVLQGKRVPVRLILTQYGMARYPYKVISEFIQAELRPLGLDVEIVMMDTQMSRKAMSDNEYDLTIGTRGLPNLDPTWILQEFFTSRGEVNKTLGYHNANIERWFEELDHTYELPKRQILYDNIIQELLKHPAVVPLFEDMNLAVHNKAVEGYHAVVYGITLDKIHWANPEGGAK